MPTAPANAGKPSSDGFDWSLCSSITVPPVERWRYATLAAMLEAEDAEQDRQPLLIGANQAGPLELALADLRRTAVRARQWCHDQHIAPGDSLLLVRLPHSSEAPLAAAVVALMSLGRRVVLPMSFDRATLALIAEATGSRAILWCGNEVASTSHAQVCQADEMYHDVADTLGLATFSLDGELAWHRPTSQGESIPSGSTEPDLASDREVLVLSTSGSTGKPKLVRYTERALLKVAEAWNASGLMSLELTGGRSICPALSHSMGLRNVLHAIWNRQPTLLAQPEWLEDRPKRFVQLLERCLPQHITCGPALLADLRLLAGSVRRVRDALSSLRCVVSSGAVEAANNRVLPDGVLPANAFGMTEVQQVLNTLLGPPSDVPGALGRPLPGVSVAVRYVDRSQRLGRLFVASPFAGSGYVGAPDFPAWFDTGDLVRIEGGELVWMGRADADFLNTGQGVKISLAELRDNYKLLERAAEAVLFVESPTRGGVAAVVYVGERDPAAAEIQQNALKAIADDHNRMASHQRDFSLTYMAIAVVGCVAGRPPRLGPGKIDRTRALAEQADLLAAMDKISANHPQVIDVPQYGSDKPDWRRYASGGS